MNVNTEFCQTIAGQIVNCGELDITDWVEFSAIFGFDDDGDVNISYGYAYDRAGISHAVAFLYDPVEREVKRYREWLSQDGQKGFDKLLFQFNRLSRKFNADFAYDEPDKWQVTPANIDNIAEHLRPQLGVI